MKGRGLSPEPSSCDFYNQNGCPYDEGHEPPCARQPRPTSGRVLSPEERLLEIDRLWYVRVNKGERFLSNPDDVKAMRVLLDGYTHPDTVPHDD